MLTGRCQPPGCLRALRIIGVDCKLPVVAVVADLLPVIACTVLLILLAFDE